MTMVYLILLFENHLKSGNNGIKIEILEIATGLSKKILIFARIFPGQ